MYWSMSTLCPIPEDFACGVIHALSAAEARARFRLLGESRAMD